MVSPGDFPSFRQRWPWIGGDLQTLRNFLLRSTADLSRWPSQRLHLPLGDGSGDQLAAMLHRPESDGAKPLALLIHGLTGCEDSRHIRASAAALLAQGYPVVRLNLRGAGPSGPLCRQLYHAGRSEDLSDALKALAQQAGSVCEPGLVSIGFSLGANTLIKFLAEAADDPSILAAVSVSAPIDLQAAQRRIMEPRNRLYQRYLLERMVTDALASPCALDTEEQQRLRAITNVYDFDDRFVAPRNGFAGAEDYYARSSARRFLSAVRVPTLVIQASDDPWIPHQAYRSFDWQANPRLVPLLSARGGHVGFHGSGSPIAWHNRCILQFLERFWPDRA